MRRATKVLALSVIALGGLLSGGASTANAQGFGYGGYSGGFYGGGYPGGYYGGGYPGGYIGGFNAVPGYSYYGNGGHDAAPHWHNTQIPMGSFSWYGNGAHDFRPHGHTVTPFGVTSYSGGLFSRTQSYSPPSPYVYMPW